MKKKSKLILSCLVTILITLFLLNYVTFLCERKSSYIKYNELLNKNYDYDVLFIGTSHVINGIYPMELWNDYGITAYNCGGHGNTMPTSYWVMKNALKYAKPKVVVIDCLCVESNFKCSTNFSFVHLSLDAFPISPTKIMSIKDLLDDDYMDKYLNDNVEESYNLEPRTQLGLLWDYSVYHSRWDKLEEYDFVPPNSIKTKGAEERIAVTPMEYTRFEESDISPSVGSVGEQYLCKMIEECRDNDIEVLLTFLPFPAVEWQQVWAEYVQSIAEEYDVGYINFLDKELVNYEIDMYDEEGHLNPSGAQKVTNYIGQHLVDNYNVSDHRGNIKYNEWNNDYLLFAEDRIKNICEQDDLVTYLMLIAAYDYDADIYIKNVEILNCKLFESLLSNIKSSIRLEETSNIDHDIVIRVTKKGRIIDEVGFDYQEDAVLNEIVTVNANRNRDI